MVTEQTFESRLARSKLRKSAKRLRTEQTDAEWKLWHKLRAHRFGGYKFKRQFPVGPYIADFVCLKAKLIVELDGG